jgi:hypothetical protein
MGRWIAIAVTLGLVCASHASAQKPVKPPKTDDPIGYNLVEPSGLEGWPSAINPLDGGASEVVGRVVDDSGEVEVERTHYWMGDSAGNVLLSFDLQTLSPHEPGAATVGSFAFGANYHGTIVGGLLEEGSDYQCRRPLLWPSAASGPIALPEGAFGAC